MVQRNFVKGGCGIIGCHLVHVPLSANDNGKFLDALIDQLHRNPPVPIPTSTTPVDVEMADWRICDQRYAIPDTFRLEKRRGWRDGVASQNGVHDLVGWLSSERFDSRGLAPAPGRVQA